MNKYALLIILAAALLFAGCIQKPPQASDTLSYEKAIIEDATAKYPDADIVEIEGTETTGDINITNVRVTFNSTSVCPVRMRLRYKAPEFGYETGVQTYIVRDCRYTCEANCVITGEEEAIVASHSLKGSESVSGFIGDGQGVSAKATYSVGGGEWTVVLTKAGGEMEVKISARNPEILSVNENIPAE